MGQQSSTPTGETVQHIFSSSTTPVKMSTQVQQSLQQSPESDHTRSSRQESHIQSRVASELRALSARANSALHQAESSTSTPASSKPPSAENDLNRAQVQSSIASLRRKLGERRVEEVDKEVEKARDEMVGCLRVNDRRPLDCWREVERFREEVRRLEGKFVERALG